MGKAPILGLLGRERSAISFLEKSLNNIFSGAIEIETFFLPDDEYLIKKKANKIPVVITSYSGFYNDAKVLFTKSQIIRGDKALSGFNLEKVIMLPAGEKVLVINNPRRAVLESIENLVELGINHLQYLPFVPGDECPPDVYTAVSPGLIHHCPPQIKYKIDIGYRNFSIDALNRVIRAFNLDTHYLDKLTAQYHLPLILSSNKLVENLEKVSLLDRERELIINKIPDAVLSVDFDLTVTSLNRTMEVVVGRSADNVIGQNVDELICSLNSDKKLLYDLDEGISSKIRLKGKDYMYSLTTMQAGRNKKYIFIFKESVQEQEHTKSKFSHSGYNAKYKFDDFWGDSPRVIEFKKRALLFAKNDASTLIYGESGTGKEIIAQAMHNQSLRKNAPFFAVNFAAIAESLVESELFGYERGAFTGASKEGKPGYFEMANGGTLFLDEIGSMPLSLQGRLLRVLQEREIIRIGGSKIIPIDVRIIAATNIDLKKHVETGGFRQDLYFRLNVLSLNTVALRDFKDSMEKMIKRHLREKYAFSVDLSDNEVKTILMSYNWPGNVRELLNVADYMYYSSEGNPIICRSNLPQYLINEATPKCLIKRRCKISDDENLIEAILKIYAQAGNDEPLGRMAVKAQLGNDYAITEHYLKLLLEKMQKLDLIKAGSTRQGTKITQKGYHYLSEKSEL